MVRDGSTAERRLEGRLRRLRSTGHRITAQRRAVLRALAMMGCACGAEDVHARARRIYPRLGLVTVYRTLAALVRAGLAQTVQRVGGDRIRVQTLVPPGAEPHDYEPRPQDITALHAARVIIYNGAGLETWLEKLRPEFPARGVIVNASDGLPLVKGIDEREGGAQGEPPARFDPHVWLDPQLPARMGTHVARGLPEAGAHGSGGCPARA